MYLYFSTHCPKEGLKQYDREKQSRNLRKQKVWLKRRRHRRRKINKNYIKKVKKMLDTDDYTVDDDGAADDTIDSKKILKCFKKSMRMRKRKYKKKDKKGKKSKGKGKGKKHSSEELFYKHTTQYGHQRRQKYKTKKHEDNNWDTFLHGNGNGNSDTKKQLPMNIVPPGYDVCYEVEMCPDGINIAPSDPETCVSVCPTDGTPWPHEGCYQACPNKVGTYLGNPAPENCIDVCPTDPFVHHSARCYEACCPYYNDSDMPSIVPTPIASSTIEPSSLEPSIAPASLIIATPTEIKFCDDGTVAPFDPMNCVIVCSDDDGADNGDSENCVKECPKSGTKPYGCVDICNPIDDFAFLNGVTRPNQRKCKERCCADGTSEPVASSTTTPSLVPTSLIIETPTSPRPTSRPITTKPSKTPTSMSPSMVPSNYPTQILVIMPTGSPVIFPSAIPTSSKTPTVSPSVIPSGIPSIVPSGIPSIVPSGIPSIVPSGIPSIVPSGIPSIVPSGIPSIVPSGIPSIVPSETPSIVPSGTPSIVPTKTPRKRPTGTPTDVPSGIPTVAPSESPTSAEPTLAPSTILPTTDVPSNVPTSNIVELCPDGSLAPIDLSQCVIPCPKSGPRVDDCVDECPTGVEAWLNPIPGCTVTCPPIYDTETDTSIVNKNCKERCCSPATITSSQIPTPVPTSMVIDTPTTIPTEEPTGINTTPPASITADDDYYFGDDEYNYDDKYVSKMSSKTHNGKGGGGKAHKGYSSYGEGYTGKGKGGYSNSEVYTGKGKGKGYSTITASTGRTATGQVYSGKGKGKGYSSTYSDDQYYSDEDDDNVTDDDSVHPTTIHDASYYVNEWVLSNGKGARR
jgi:hypothetical protein